MKRENVGIGSTLAVKAWSLSEATCVEFTLVSQFTSSLYWLSESVWFGMQSLVLIRALVEP